MIGMIRQFICLALLSVVAGLLTWAFHPNAPSWTGGWSSEGAVSHAFVVSNQDRILWVDARSESEFEAGHIAGAILVNEDDWEAGLMRLFDVWDMEQILIIYCGAEACQSSLRVMERLRAELGEDEIYYLKGGWKAWQATDGGGY